jgi:hypothetical protein
MGHHTTLPKGPPQGCCQRVWERIPVDFGTGVNHTHFMNLIQQKKELVIAFRDDDTNRRRIEFLNKILTED